jgi:tetratricopeptide (TPR) repeat protein
MTLQEKDVPSTTDKHQSGEHNAYFYSHFLPPGKHSFGRNFFYAATLSVLLSACSQIDPNSTTGQPNYARRVHSYIDAGQYRAAHIELRNAEVNDEITVSQRNELAYAKARWFAALGQHKGTIKTITEVPIEARTADMQITLLEAYLASGKLLSAEGILQQENGPALPEPVQRLARAKITLGRGNAAEALKQFSKLSADLAPAPSDDAAQDTSDSASTVALSSDSFDMYAKAQLGVADSNMALRNGVGAEMAINSILSFNKNHVPALLAKAKLAALQRDFETAEDALSTALIALPDTDIMKPEKSKVLSAFVAILSHQGRTSEALVYSKILAEQNPEATELRNQLDAALALWREGKLPEAQEQLLAIYKQAPTDRVGTLIGLVSFLNGDQETANAFFDRHIDAETANANILMAMTRVFVQEGRMTETIALIEQAHRNNPKDGRITALLGALRLANGNAAGFSIMEEGLKQEPKQLQMWMALAQARRAIQKDNEKAAQTLEAALTHFPKNANLRRALVDALARNKQGSRAQSLVDKWLSKEGESVDNLLLAANLALAKKNNKLADQYLEKARTKEPENHYVYSGLALTALAGGNFEKARASAQKLIELKPDLPLPYMLFGQAQYRLTPTREQVASALRDIVQAQERAAGYVALFDFHFAGDELTDAGTALKQARELDPGFDGLNDRAAKLSYQLGRNAISERQYPQAREHLVHALKYNPELPTLNNLLIRLELELGNLREAEKLLLQLPEDALDDKTKAQLNGELALKQGDFATAESVLLNAWEKAPSDAVGQVIYKTYAKQSKPVLPFLEDWQSKTKSTMATLYRANELVRSADYKAAVAEYEKIAPSIERNASALNNLAWSYQQVNDKRAAETAKAAVALAPDDAAVLDTYGFILLKNGQKDKAKEFLERAHELAPDNADIKAHWEEVNR